MADRKKLLDRAKALIARSASDSEEEARTSALLACRLMREQGFELVDPETHIHIVPPHHASSTDPFNGINFEDLLRDMVNKGRARDPFQEDYRTRVEQERVRQAGHTNNRARREADARRQANARKRQEEFNRKNIEAKRRKREHENRPCPTNQPTGTMFQKKNIKWKAYPADIAGECVGCSRPFDEGDPIVWAAGFGVFRSQCIQGKKDEFLFVARQLDQVDERTEATKPEPMESPPMFCKARVWTKLYNSGYTGRCSKCREKIYKGDPIRWARGFGSFHVECWNELDDHEELEVREMLKAVDAVKRECRNSDWDKLKSSLP